ncbi:MAG: glycosyltransferase family 10 [Bacteroidota bacterium]
MLTNDKIIVKVTHPWPDLHSKKDPILGQTPNASGIWGNYQFEVNNDCTECDYWIIADDITKPIQVKVPAGNVILLTTEEVDVKTYEPNYLKQFDRIITSRSDIQSQNVIHSHYINWWFVKKGLDELSQNSYLDKTKTISLVSSNLTKTQGHKDRFAFAQKLMDHFKDRLDVYGRGFNFIEDKFDAIAPYKYSIVIENSSIEDYFTEKLIDCYLCNTMPIYFGCPNIAKYFNPKSMILIDIHNYQSSIRTIEKAIEEDIYTQSIDYIKEAKKLALQQYQFFPAISSMLGALNSLHSTAVKKLIKIYPQDKYVSGHQTTTGYKSILKTGLKFIKSRLR